VADAAQDLGAVALELLPAAAAVTVPTAGELVVELLGREGDARGEALQDGDQRLPVGLPGGEQAQQALILGNGISASGREGGPRAESGAGRYFRAVVQSVNGESP